MRYSLRHEYATAVVVTDGDIVQMELRLTPQARLDEETDRVMMRFPPFAGVIAYADPDEADEDLVEKTKAGLVDYLEAFIELNGPDGILRLLRELGFEEDSEHVARLPTWSDVPVVLLRESLSGPVRSRC